MASKSTNLNAVPNRDIMQRMNYLWQASAYLQSLNTSSVPNPEDTNPKSKLKEKDVPALGDDTTGKPEGKRAKKKGTTRKKVSGRDLARIYTRTMKVVGQKTTVKMDPGVKRTLCRGCSTILIPGISVRVRARPSSKHGHRMAYTCLECGMTRSLPSPRSGGSGSGGDGFAAAGGAATSIDVDPALGDEPSDQVWEDNQTSVDGLALDSAEGVKKDTAKQKTRKAQQKEIVRVPPLFAKRDAGHVVYRGGEVVDMEGVYCV